MDIRTLAGSKNVLTRSKETFAVTADVTRYMLNPIISRRMSNTVMELKTMDALRGSCMAAVYSVSAWIRDKLVERTLGMVSIIRRTKKPRRLTRSRRSPA